MVSSDVAKRAIGAIKRVADYEYFFAKLNSPEWIVPLWREGMFREPSRPLREGKYISFPFWPESQYLVRMAKSDSLDVKRIVSEVALEIPETDNVRVHEDLAEIALALPGELSGTFVPKAAGWLKSPYQVLLPSKLGALVSHLAKAGQVNAALDLAKALLAVQSDSRISQKATEPNRLLSPTALPLFEFWTYEQIILKNVPDLVAAARRPALTLLCDLLDDAVRISRRGDEVQGTEDYSYIWYRAIDHGQSADHDVRGLLVSAVRDAGENLCKQDPSIVGEIVRDLEKRPWHIFYRLALHFLRLFADAAPALVGEHLGDPERFDLPDFRREYNLLAKERFRHLSPDVQYKILAWIDESLSPDSVKIRLAEFAGRPVTDEEVVLSIKDWQRDRLAPIADDLPEDWCKRYRKLVEEVGPARKNAGVLDIRGGAFAPKSPIGSADLRKMTIEQLVDYLKTWVPSGEPMSESMEGLGNQLGAVVAGEPERYSAESERFKDLDPTYVRALLQALWRPVEEERAIAWGPVLSLCRWVMDQPREIPGRRGGPLDRDPDWGWARNAIGKLLSDAFDHSSIPSELRNDAWNSLNPLTEDPMPTREDEARYSQSMDPVTYSINTVRGEAMHTLIRYALWVRRCLEKEPDGKARVAHGFDEMPEVRSVLEKHLDPNFDPSIAIRAVYGQRFPGLHFLDRIWAKANVTKIFPGDDASKALRDAAWRAYIIFCQPCNELFDALLEEYRRAIEAIGTSSQNRQHLDNPDSRLAEHLMVEYWWGHIDWEKPGGLLEKFYANADPKLRGWALEFVGRSLHEESGEIPAEILERLKSLWLKRFGLVRAAGKGSPESEESRSFGSWFISKKFENKWAIEQLREVLLIAGRVGSDHLVVERLAGLVKEMPSRSIECLSMIVEGDTDGWGILVWREHARTVLSAAINSQDVEAQNSAVNLIHRLGARGYFEFRDILSSKSAI